MYVRNLQFTFTTNPEQKKWDINPSYHSGGNLPTSGVVTLTRTRRLRSRAPAFGLLLTGQVWYLTVGRTSSSLSTQQNFPDAASHNARNHGELCSPNQVHTSRIIYCWDEADLLTYGSAPLISPLSRPSLCASASCWCPLIRFSIWNSSNPSCSQQETHSKCLGLTHISKVNTF